MKLAETEVLIGWLLIVIFGIIIIILPNMFLMAIFCKEGSSSIVYANPL